MLEQLRKNWWVLAVRGTASILFGIAAFLWPGLTLATLVIVFGAYAIVDGAFAIAAAVRHRGERPHAWTLALAGVLGIVAGAVAWTWPGITLLALVAVVSAWAVITGALQIATAIRLRKEIEGEWLLATAGLAQVALGALLLFRPMTGALALLWTLGVYAIAFGALLFGLAISLRTGGRRARPARPAHA